MRIGLVGAGSIARNHVSALLQVPGVGVSAVTDLRRESAQWLIDETGAAFEPDVESLADKVDAAYVLTPPRARVGVVRTLAERGVPMFCEKPLAASLDDAEAIASIVRRSGVTFMVGFMRRWHAPNRALRAIVVAGELGAPVLIQRTRVGHLELNAGNWRTDPRQLCGITVESASHDLDLLRWIGGDLDDVRGHAIESRGDLPGYDESVVATGRFVSGAAAALQVSWQSRIGRNQTLVVGTEGTALLTGDGMWGSTELRVESDSGSRRVRFSADETADDGYGAQAEAFVRLASGADVEYPGIADALATVRLSQQILESSVDRSLRVPAA